MAMKKKKAEKRANPVSTKTSPARKKAMKPSGPAPESPRPVFAGISMSVANLLDRTKAYLGSGKKAEA
jgi:hypothetical protein